MAVTKGQTYRVGSGVAVGHVVRHSGIDEYGSEEGDDTPRGADWEPEGAGLLALQVCWKSRSRLRSGQEAAPPRVSA